MTRKRDDRRKNMRALFAGDEAARVLAILRLQGSGDLTREEAHALLPFSPPLEDANA